MKKRELSTQLTAGALVGVVIIFGILYLAYLSQESFKKTIITKTQQHLLTIAKTTAISLEEYITKHSEALPIISKNPLFQEQKHDYHLLKILYESHKDDVDAIYLLDSDGIVLFRYPLISGNESRVGMNYSDRPGVAYVLREHKSYFSEIFHSNSGVPAFSIIEPIFHEGNLVGMVRWLITLDTLTKRFIQPIRAGKKGYGQLLDSNGVLLAHPRKDQVGEHNIFPVL